MTVTILVAVAENGVIGASGTLPWHLPNDFRRVKRRTTGHSLIMGRKTFESIGKPLPDRRSIVLSRDPDLVIDGADVTDSLESALALAEEAGETEAFVFGGAGVFARALELDLVDRLEVTLVHAEIEGDVRFPEWDPSQWRLVADERFERDRRHAHDYSFRSFVRRRDEASGPRPGSNPRP